MTTASLAGAQGSPDRVPVEIGGAAGEDACGSYGRVDGLRADGDNFLNLRHGPDTAYAVEGRLSQGQGLWICDASGDWLAVVVDDGSAGCGVSTPVASRQAYGGPCPSGWVHRSYVAPLAG